MLISYYSAYQYGIYRGNAQVLEYFWVLPLLVKIGAATFEANVTIILKKK